MLVTLIFTAISSCHVVVCGFVASMPNCLAYSAFRRCQPPKPRGLGPLVPDRSVLARPSSPDDPTLGRERGVHLCPSFRTSAPKAAPGAYFSLLIVSFLSCEAPVPCDRGGVRERRRGGTKSGGRELARRRPS